ncbi:YggS family pyridoxal phosphate-dependent enzyme [bacterium]|nr:YggS family pyridoxal phosphate-dependent enzyme [bacterium]
MSAIRENIEQIKSNLGKVQLVVDSKYRTLEELKEVYDAGERDFGENRVQELMQKVDELPSDIRWHAIGHLQRNKVKYIAPFVHLIHSVDSVKLLRAINKEAKKVDRVIPVLLQVHIADEESKFGFDQKELEDLLQSNDLEELPNVQVKGLMGMATLTDDHEKIATEFASLKSMYDQFQSEYSFDTLSMGMSSDYEIAIAQGSNMVRVGSKVFEK